MHSATEATRPVAYKDMRERVCELEERLHHLEARDTAMSLLLVELLFSSIKDRQWAVGAANYRTIMSNPGVMQALAACQQHAPEVAALVTERMIEKINIESGRVKR